MRRHDAQNLALMPAEFFKSAKGARGDDQCGKPQAKQSGWCIVCLIGVYTTVAAVTINPGDILVSDLTTNAVIQVNPVTGTQTLVSQGENLNVPWGIKITATNDIFLAEQSAAAVLRIDPTTGAQTIVSQGGCLTQSRMLSLQPMETSTS